MNLMRMKIIDRRVAHNGLVQLQMLTTATSANPASEIKIPLRKERGPTDILRALETTVSRDYTAPDYKYMDDPFLIPTSNHRKRGYSLSKEAGKKAAMWILQEHADLLRSNLSEPLVKAFLPRDEYKDKSQVSDEILQNFIKLGMVSESLNVYELLDGNIKNGTKQAFLELLCFYNSDTNQIPEEFTEERLYQPEGGITRNIWRSTPTIEQLFNDLKQDETYKAAAYNALICGVAKYMKVDLALELYQECQDKNIPLDVTTYNSLIEITHILKDKSDEQKLMIQKFFATMAQKNVKPNVNTLNAALKCVSHLGNPSDHQDFALNVLGEFKFLGIEPSLATYYYLLKIYYDRNAPPSGILTEILDNIECVEELKVQNIDDKEFLCAAMEAAYLMRDLESAHRIHRILLKNKNYKFLGGQMKENIYYRNYMQTIVDLEPIDEFMKIYDLLVPNIYVPETAVLRDILEMLRLNEKETISELLPKFLSQIIQFGMLDRYVLLKVAFDLMSNSGHPDQNSPLHEKYADFAEKFFKHIQDNKMKRIQKQMWPSSVFGDMGVIFSRGDRFDKMLEVVNVLLDDPQSIIGTIDPTRVQEMFAACIARGHVQGAMSLIQYSHENGFNNTTTNAKILKEVLPLSGAQQSQLNNLLGSGFLNSPTQTKSRSQNIDE
ncbi:hypothetical protein QAD02_017463 [Eretmocerus hayati]|uniref:Uncharacterized protein n=1 Tax=Eretmocerus hayati TaxID=131215 RepID=A0ACC2PFS3_9HYME|nr:hypothetical protein QAD02_017463 [Eretmocerus hayati]